MQIQPERPTFMEVKADKRAAAGWKPVGAAIRSLWSMTTDFRLFGSQALQRCSGLLNRRARGSTVATHQFQWKLNRTSMPGLFRKQIVPHRGMGSMPSGFRHLLPAWMDK